MTTNTRLSAAAVATAILLLGAAPAASASPLYPPSVEPSTPTVAPSEPAPTTPDGSAPPTEPAEPAEPAESVEPTEAVVLPSTESRTSSPAQVRQSGPAVANQSLASTGADVGTWLGGAAALVAAGAAIMFGARRRSHSH